MQTTGTTTTTDTSALTAPAGRRPGRHVLGVALLTLVATAVLALSGGQSAGAWVYGASSGRPGAVVEISQVQLADIYSGSNTLGQYPQATFMMNNGPLISRSPATTGNQDVYVVYLVQRWTNNQWATVATPAAGSRLPAGYSRVRLAPLNLAPNAAKGIYRVTLTVLWYVGGANTNVASPLGVTSVNPDRVSDMACITRVRPCQVSAGYLQYGAVGGGW
jgi:hypothetical protein